MKKMKFAVISAVLAMGGICSHAAVAAPAQEPSYDVMCFNGDWISYHEKVVDAHYIFQGRVLSITDVQGRRYNMLNEQCRIEILPNAVSEPKLI